MFFSAACSGNVPAVVRYLQKGGDVNAWNHDGCTALHLASRGGRKDIIRLLLDAGANPFAVSRDGREETPLCLAFCKLIKDDPIIQYMLKTGLQRLLKVGANVHAFSNDEFRETALHIASRRVGVKCSKDRRNKHHDPLIQCLLEDYVLGIGRRGRGHYYDYEYFNSRVVQWLLEAGADPNALNAAGETPLHETGRSRGNRVKQNRVVQLLLDAGADPCACDTRGLSSLLRVAQGYNFRLVKPLVQAGGDLTAVDSQGNTPLHLAAGRSAAMARTLVEAGADVHATNNHGKTPLMQAVRWPSLSHWGNIADKILNAAMAGPRSLHQLLEVQDNKYQRTGLHWACLCPYSEYSDENAKPLVNRGANLFARDRNNKTPFDLIPERCSKRKLYFMQEFLIKFLKENKREITRDPDDYMMAGQCPECQGYGPLGNYCTECEDSGMTFDSFERLLERRIGNCNSCGHLGVRDSLCTECCNGVYSREGDSSLSQSGTDDSARQEWSDSSGEPGRDDDSETEEDSLQEFQDSLQEFQFRGPRGSSSSSSFLPLHVLFAEVHFKSLKHYRPRTVVQLRLGTLETREFVTLLDMFRGDQVFQLRDDKGRFPMHIACGKGAPAEILQLLARRGGLDKVEVADLYGALPLHALCESKNITFGAVRFLIQAYPVAPAVTTSQGDTPLALVCRLGHTSSSSILLELLRHFPAGLQQLLTFQHHSK